MKTIVAVLLFLLAACATGTGEPQTPAEQWQKALRVWGEAIVYVELVPAMKEQAPELFRLLDANADQVLSLDELARFDPLAGDVVTAIVIYTTVKRLAKRR